MAHQLKILPPAKTTVRTLDTAGSTLQACAFLQPAWLKSSVKSRKQQDFIRR